MKRLVIFLAMLPFGSVAALGQTGTVSVTPHRLRTMTPSELRSLLFDENAPEFVESWVEGPRRQDQSITVELAARPRATSYSGLCAVEIGLAHARWAIGQQTEDSPLEVRRGSISTRFMLESDSPTPARSGSEPCSKLSALFPKGGPLPIAIWYSEGNSPAASANAEAARFGFAAFSAAKKAADRIPIETERCGAGVTAIPLACNAPAHFVSRAVNLKTLVVQRCNAGGTLCVDATLERGAIDCAMPWWAGSCGSDHLVIETDTISLAEGAAAGRVTVKSIVVRAGEDPIP